MRPRPDTMQSRRPRLAMFQGVLRPFVFAALSAVAISACGGSPTSPKPPAPPPPIEPPANVAPTIESIAVQGRRVRQPARFADVGETVDVSATVTDPETAVDELTYEWTATVGTVSGTGRVVTWTAPDATTPTPSKVTLTLKVIEKYGHPGQPKNFSQEVTKSVEVALHDSVKEVSDMARQFLLDFSDTRIKDANYIMRNFGAGSRCPEPGEVSSERADVVNNFTNYDMKAFSVGSPATTVNFGAACAVVGTKGDACSVVAVMWDSVFLADGTRGVTRGDDIISAAYAPAESRWWLCSSRYRPYATTGAVRFIR